MTLVSSEDYAQSKSFMVKGSRNSVKKKISKTRITNRLKTPENERHSWP